MVSGTTINADRIKTNYSLDLNGNIIAKNGWDVYEYDFTQSSGNTVFGVDFTVTGTKGIEWQNGLTFNLVNSSITSYDDFFVNFNMSTLKADPDTYYYGTINYPEFEIIIEKSPSYNGPAYGTVLKSNKLSVCENMQLHFQNFKSVECVPTVVAFNGSRPVVSKSCWEDGAFTYKVPSGVNYVIIQCKSNFEYTSITSEMPEVLLVGAYKKEKDGSITFKKTVLTTNKDYENNKAEIKDGLSKDIIYYKNYIIESSVNLVRATIKHGGNITLKKNTKNKTGLVTYDRKDSSYLPNAAGTVESVSYTILSNKIKRLERLLSSRLFYESIQNAPKNVSYFNNDAKYVTEKLLGKLMSGETLNVDYEVSWDSVKGKPTWLIDNIPNAEYFGAVPLTRKINGQQLTKDINLTLGGGNEGSISELLTIDETLFQVIDVDKFFIKEKLIFNSNAIAEDIDRVEVDSGNSAYFEWDTAVSALSFNGSIYTVSGLSSLDGIIANDRLYFDKDKKIIDSSLTTYIKYDDGNLLLHSSSGKTFTIDIDTVETNKLYFDSAKTAYFQWDKDKKALYYSGMIYANELVSAKIPSSAYTDNKLLYNDVRINGSALTSSTTISIVNSAFTAYSANTITSGSITGNLNVNGNITASGEITAYSDARLKRVIDELTFRGRLRPILFNWQSGDTETHIGFIAQEIERDYPELIHKDENGMLSLNYGAVTAVLSSQINKLEDNISLLTDKVNSLENNIRNELH